MLLLLYLNPKSYTVTIFLDAALILVFMFPGLYYFFYKPMVAYLNERKHNEMILRTSEEKLRISNEELKKSNCEKDKLFSIIAHDLRSPLNSLLGFSEIMLKKGNQLTTAEMQLYAGHMHGSANNLYALLENLLLWSQTKQDTFKLQKDHLQLQSIVLIVFSLYHEIAKSKGVKLENCIPADQTIIADNNALQVVLRNLISNAIKFTDHGGEVHVSSVTTINGKTQVCISDSGIGMNEMMLKNVFSIDEKVNRKGTAGEQSTGLGLILCKEFIERQDGTIEIESREGEGTKVVFSL